MAKKFVSGNEAIAYGALSAGAKVVSGYPGTPSTEVITTLLNMNDIEETKVEWSVNEKVAFEVAAGAALNGYRAMCTMKMSGLNVAYDSLIGIAYSGCTGGLVIYVADDPGVSAGMCEQDTRGFAIMSDMPMLEPATVQESYDLTKYAFELSEKIQSPVFLRSVTSVSQSHTVAEIGERVLPPEGKPLFTKDIDKYTKAGAVLCMDQHMRLIESLNMAEEKIEADGLNELNLAGPEGGVGIISVGVVNTYIDEAFEKVKDKGIDVENISTLKLRHTLPYAENKILEMIKHCSKIIIAEELEPHLENKVYLEAYKLNKQITILGKNDGTYKRIGYYDSTHIIEGLFKAFEMEIPDCMKKKDIQSQKLCAARPITVCAGCPHRGTYLSINAALKNLKMKKDEVLVTGDIGCTILGVNPPFDTLWTEVAMGASIPLAQGFSYGGTKNPVIATIGDSTFFHAGMPGLVNALQHNINMTVIIMDNGWTGMTGMQINPGTELECQKPGWKQLDIEKVIEGLQVPDVHVVDPYNLAQTTEAIEKAVKYEGVSVVLSRRQCAIQAGRRKIKYTKMIFDADKCKNCKQCISVTGCPAIGLKDGKIEIDYGQCNGCGICTQVCKFDALKKEEK